MKVLLPTNTTHTITIEPRFYPTNTLALRIVKEGYNTNTDVVPTYVINYGVMLLTFDLTGLEGERFSIKLTENNVICYRNKMFFTAQEPQDYKQSKNEYIYAG